MMGMALAWAMLGQTIAQGAGPQPPATAKASPAEQAIELYRKRDAPRPLPARCRQAAEDAITVCGVTEGARARAPLEDQGIRDGARAAIGELPSAAAIGFRNPVGIMPNTGARVTLKGGKVTAAGLGD